MMQRRSVATLLVGAVWLAAAQSGTAQSSFLTPLKTQWDNTRRLVEGLVAQVPEDKYDFRPTPEVRSFREQFTHLIGENFRFMAQAAGEPPPMEKSAIEQLKGRDDILKLALFLLRRFIVAGPSLGVALCAFFTSRSTALVT